MRKDQIDELITLRRALPSSSGGAAQISPDGTRLMLYVDDVGEWQLEVSANSDEWVLTELQPSISGRPRRVQIGTFPSEQVVSAIDREYRRLLTHRRNAACGTPTRAE